MGGEFFLDAVYEAACPSSEESADTQHDYDGGGVGMFDSQAARSTGKL